MATTEEITRLDQNWAAVIQQYCFSVDSGRLDFIPKGDPDSIVTLLSNWGQADPNTYTEPTEAQLLTALAVVEAENASATEADSIAVAAETGFNTIPNWATWTAAEAEAWIETNVTDLASAKVVLKKLAIAVMFLADKNFPNRRSVT